jgi:hypothetical protein
MYTGVNFSGFIRRVFLAAKICLQSTFHETIEGEKEDDSIPANSETVTF